MSDRNNKICDRLTAISFVMVVVLGCAGVIRYVTLGAPVAVITVVILESLFACTAFTAWKGRVPMLLALVGIGSFFVGFFMNNWPTMLDNVLFWIQSVLAMAGAVAGTVWAVWKKCRHRKVPVLPGCILLCVVAAVLLTWKIQVDDAKSAAGSAEKEIWAVPSQFDSQECDQAGSVVELSYQTKAYGTDMRTVEKKAYVYLPHGYDETQPYNILYLMHGTGNDEAYWLKDHAYNKTMVDHMIAKGDIQPLIIVTPTFYVENDCLDNLDTLTYSFAQELRNDLMPAVESAYSTYAESCDPEGFTNSREHRAFAGLSRGAVTTYHAAMCASLDYFSWFGCFSGSRTTAEYFRETLQSEEFANYSINYLYVSSGNFDFALANQLVDYQALLDAEPRLTYGENTEFDVYPMRYHSIGSWHLALYNCLQKIF